MSPSGLAAFQISDSKSILGRNWTDLWKEEDRPRVQEALEKARAGGVGSYQADGATPAGARHY
jgi:hypothetical protein